MEDGPVGWRAGSQETRGQLTVSRPGAKLGSRDPAPSQGGETRREVAGQRPGAKQGQKVAAPKGSIGAKSLGPKFSVQSSKIYILAPSLEAKKNGLRLGA